MKYFLFLFCFLVSCSVCRDYELAVVDLGRCIVNDYKTEIQKSQRTEEEKQIICESCDEYIKMLVKESD